MSQCKITFLGTLQCITILGYRKLLGIRERSRYHDLPSKLFCLTVTKKFLGETFGFSEKFGLRKICIRGRYYKFPPATFFPHSGENFAGKPFCSWEKISYQNISCIGGGRVSPFSVEIFCITVPKHFVGEPFCVSESFLLGKKLRKRKWVGITIVLKFFCLTVSKQFVGNPSSFQ